LAEDQTPTGGVLKIHFLQNTYYYLSITYKLFKKMGFSFHLLLFSKKSEIRFLLAVEMTTMFDQGLWRGKADAKRPLFPSQQPFKAAVISMEQSDREIYFITRHLKNN
jgi:hypothetical protein